MGFKKNIFESILAFIGICISIYVIILLSMHIPNCNELCTEDTVGIIIASIFLIISCFYFLLRLGNFVRTRCNPYENIYEERV